MAARAACWQLQELPRSQGAAAAAAGLPAGGRCQPNWLHACTPQQRLASFLSCGVGGMREHESCSASPAWLARGQFLVRHRQKVPAWLALRKRAHNRDGATKQRATTMIQGAAAAAAGLPVGGHCQPKWLHACTPQRGWLAFSLAVQLAGGMNITQSCPLDFWRAIAKKYLPGWLSENDLFVMAPPQSNEQRPP